MQDDETRHNTSCPRLGGTRPRPVARLPRTWWPNALLPWAILACAVLALVAGCGRAPSLDAVRKIQEAQQIFDTAESPQDFLRAAGLYEEIREAGLVSGAVLFNQGNAYMRAGRRGEAIACYRQARRFRPRDPYREANLRYALGGAATLKSGWLPRYVFFWQDWLSYREKFLLTAILTCLAIALAAGAVFVRQARTWWRAVAVVLVLVGVAGSSAAYDWYRFDVLEHGVVTADQVIARKGDGENYEPAFDQPLSTATEFLVLRERNGWLLIQLAGNQQGWVPADEVVVY